MLFFDYSPSNHYPFGGKPYRDGQSSYIRNVLFHIFVLMKKTLILLLSICTCITAAAFTDHRGHNVDSLETVMARWTASDIANAGETELKDVAENLEGLMYGFCQTNGVKSEYYARMLLSLSERFGWHRYEQLAAKNIGQHFWHKEQYDSAAFYYNIAMDAAGKMQDQEDVDDALSQMYGTLGNLYSMMDSVSLAMEYYQKAGEIFKKHSWNESSATLYYNMGETMRDEGKFDQARKYYQESLDYSLLAGDSLAVATAYKGLGSVYMEMRKTAKAMRYLGEANLYFAVHEDEEIQSRMESLDYTSQVLTLQKRRLWIIILLLVAMAILVCATFVILKLLKRTSIEKNELSAMVEDVIETISNTPEHNEIKIKPREKEILDLIAKGYTNAEIASSLCLSPETIKWYKKKLFAMFDVSNSAELIKIATDKKFL